MGRTAALHNLGCKVNAYETDAMQELLERGGYEIVPFTQRADVYVINTCSVTNMADRKSRQMIHRARSRNPEAVIVAAGCYVQALVDGGGQDANIDIIIGNNKKKELVQLLDDYFAAREPAQVLDVVDISREKEYEPLSLSRTAGHTRAYLKVQDGCNQFCTYCIIPYARGRVRSRALADVAAEVEQLAAGGYQEIVLTGIHLSSYGRDFAPEEKADLLDLIRAVHRVEGIARIRLGSLEPGIITEEFAGALAELPKVCPHFHLSLQSGCDATLRRMNRRYTTREYEEKCQILRRYFRNPALTTDVIVGFPQETEEEFRASRDFVDRMDFYETHIFKYSRRKGTRAAVMDGQIAEAVKTARSNELLELGRRKREAYERQFLGSTVEVLFEEEVQLGGRTCLAGHTREYLRVAIPAQEEQRNRWIGQLIPIKIENISHFVH